MLLMQQLVELHSMRYCMKTTFMIIIVFEAYDSPRLDGGNVLQTNQPTNQPMARGAGSRQVQKSYCPIFFEVSKDDLT